MSDRDDLSVIEDAANRLMGQLVGPDARAVKSLLEANLWLVEEVRASRLRVRELEAGLAPFASEELRAACDYVWGDGVMVAQLPISAVRQAAALLNPPAHSAQGEERETR